MPLSESEIQLLASIDKARIEQAPSDRQSLEAGADRFWIFAEDWSDAFDSLVAGGLIELSASQYRLTDTGAPLAQEYHRQRPDMYWYYYQKFYQAARASEAHSELCRRVFGQDLCQEGQTDMACLNDLISWLDLKPGEQVLDLGCGAGVIAGYIADTTGATVSGLDYSQPAIDEAQQRTAAGNPRLNFSQGDMNKLELAPGSFDAVISLDTLYWAADLPDTLSSLAQALRKGGRMGVFMNHHIAENEPSSKLAPEHSELAQALSGLGIAFETTDYTRAVGEFWQRTADAAADLKDRFDLEGNGFIAASQIREAEEDYLPDVRANRIARYLYKVTT